MNCFSNTLHVKFAINHKSFSLHEFAVCSITFRTNSAIPYMVILIELRKNSTIKSHMNSQWSVTEHFCF